MSGTHHRKAATVFLAAALTACGTETPPAPRSAPSATQARPPASGTVHAYVGMWVTADGYIRQELLPDGRYDEARGDRASAYTGRYEVTGEHIDYWDDSGFTADGRFDGDVLHHGGYLFYREGSAAHRQAVAERASTRPSG
ncbi:Atu4866 domain-containing protein [Micromonospora sp. WMMD1219]|uniref:Atu4866 domain-containing protein n=1 Tax=Micromonospora sp. WMMD1219 TaxID=3404115 RepID=UPI003BF5DA91